MSGYPYGGNPPQYPPPQNQIYPQIYNPVNAPPPGQPTVTGYAPPGQNPQYTYQQPGFAYAYPGQPGQPGQPSHPPTAMSYPTVTPTAPPPAYGYPGYQQPTVQNFERAIEWMPTTIQDAHIFKDKAVVAGYEGYDGSPLWLIRAKYEGDLIPGKFAAKHKAAYVAWGGNENAVHNFEICCARPEKIRWVESRDGSVPTNAVVAGHTSSGEPLYAGRAREQGSLTPGKVHQSHKVLYLSFAGKEIPHKVYEVLCTVL